MNYQDFKNKYQHKEKSQSELIFFITNRVSERVPNYSLLLGAGCSITSDINSGAELVNIWKKEYYKIFLKGEYDDKKLTEHFINDCESWYKSENEYSSLFEKIYHLPVQRRKFIQKQVDDKKPSIGYAYLVSLCEKEDRYFDTIYTTNFDDLINDSFYQFGHERPILCAHDSSVKSLSIYTDRPKIIKLHGDYLYEDIKATNSEVCKLEKNINSKFREFSKEFGLIIVGYAGNDESIMNAIEDLINDEDDDYFNNGIYWCIRKGDNVSEKVTKLIEGCNKAFFIEIDGFDEFMASINRKARNNVSIFDKFNDSRREKIIDNLVLDKFGLSKTKIIREDINSLRKQTTQKDIFEYIINFNNGADISNEINDSDFKVLLQIDSNLKDEKFSETISLCRNIIKNEISNGFRKKIYERMIDAYELMDNEYEALKCCDELIALDPYESSYVVKKSSICKDPIKRNNIIKNELDKFEHEIFYLNIYAKSMIEVNSSKNNEHKFSFEEINKIIQKSIKTSSNVNNNAWHIYLDLINNQQKEEKNQNTKDELIKKANGIFENFKHNTKNINYYKLKIHEAINDDTIQYLNSVLEPLVELHKTSRLDKKDEIERLTTRILSSSHSCSEGCYKGLISKFLNEKMFSNEKSVHINFLKCYYHTNVVQELNTGFKHLELLLKNTKSKIYRQSIIEYLCDIYNKPELAMTYLDSIKSKISSHDFYCLRSEIFLCKRNFESALSDLETAHERGLDISTYLSAKSFIFVKSERYEDAIELRKTHESTIITESLDSVIINEQYSLRKLSRKIKENTLNEIISKQKRNRNLISSTTICANIILNKNMQYKAQIIKNIEHYPGLKFQYKKWPIVPNELLKASMQNVA